MENPASYYMNLINVFIKHYNTCNGTKINMFHGIDIFEDTNDMMEEFYEHINDYKESDDDNKQLFSPDEITVDDFEQLFGLTVNDNIICICSLMIPILEYIVKEIDWVKINWKIIPLKMN